MLFSIKKIIVATGLFVSIFPAMSMDVNRVNTDKKIDNIVMVSKTRIEFQKNQKSDYFTVYNKSTTEAFGFNVEVLKWIQKDGKDTLIENKNIIAAPKSFVVQPGKYKNIRLVTEDYNQALGDYSYRVRLSQNSRVPVNPSESNNNGNKLMVNLTMTIPIFFYSDIFKEHDKLNLETTVNNNDKKITFKNNDRQHVFLKTINVDDKEYKYNWYVLPQTEIVINAKDLENTPNHKLEVVTDRMKLEK